MAFASLAGALMFGVLRPNPTWWKGIPSIAVSACMGPLWTPAICEVQGVASLAMHLAISSLVGLLAMTACRILIAVFEKDGRDYVRSFFGIKSKEADVKPDEETL